MSAATQAVGKQRKSETTTAHFARNRQSLSAKAWVREEKEPAVEAEWPEIALFLLKRMDVLGVTLADLALTSRVPLRTVYAALKPAPGTRRSSPTLKTVLALANALDVRAIFYAPKPAYKSQKPAKE